MNFRTVKKDFPIFKEHPRLVYLDSTATTHKPKAVIDAILNHYGRRNANVHRGIYGISMEATAAYEAARQAVAKFINAPAARNIIFVRNATEGVNLIARTWARQHIGRADEILTTMMEHHANIVPWHMHAGDAGSKVRFIDVTREGMLDAADIKRKTTHRTKLACFTHA